MVRTDGISPLFREGTFLRIQHICDELAAIQNSIDRFEREVAAIEHRIRWLMKEFGSNGQSTSTDDRKENGSPMRSKSGRI